MLPTPWRVELYNDAWHVAFRVDGWNVQWIVVPITLLPADVDHGSTWAAENEPSYEAEMLAEGADVALFGDEA